MPPKKVLPGIFEITFHYATVGIVVTRKDGEIIMINPAIESFFGYSEEELIGRPSKVLIPEPSYHLLSEGVRQVIHSHSEKTLGEDQDLYVLRKDGNKFPIELQMVPFDCQGGTFVISFINDISVRKEKESSLQEYQRKVDEILISLRKEKELNDLKSQFVSLASHEFKTPLSTILSSASLIEKYTKNEDQPKRDKHIERIKSAVGNLNGILNEFLSISKMENGKIGVHYLDFDLDDFIEAICIEMGDIKKPRQLIVHEHHGKKMVRLDVDLLRNILINLVSNAIKFTKDGGVIEIISERLSREVRIMVKDNGIGIPKEDQEHLFDRFFRGNNVLTIPGTGLGLHIVNSYVQLMKGSIRVISEHGNGTEIILSFKK